jgi:type II secretory pathway component PulJ
MERPFSLSFAGSPCTEALRAARTARRAKKIKISNDEDDTDHRAEQTPVNNSLMPRPDYYMFEWKNSTQRDCVNVVINLPTGTTAFENMSNVKVTVTSEEDEQSSLLLNYKWNESMMEVDKLYPFVKGEDKDENHWRCVIAHRDYVAKTFGVPGRMETTVRIPLPFKVRHDNPHLDFVKCDADGSRILHISMEAATGPKQEFSLTMPEHFYNAD